MAWDRVTLDYVNGDWNAHMHLICMRSERPRTTLHLHLISRRATYLIYLIRRVCHSCGDACVALPSKREVKTAFRRWEYEMPTTQTLRHHINLCSIWNGISHRDHGCYLHRSFVEVSRIPVFTCTKIFGFRVKCLSPWSFLRVRIWCPAPHYIHQWMEIVWWGAK